MPASTCPLDDRDLTILRHVADGASDRATADAAGVTPKSVSSRISRMVRRTNCRTRAHLVATAIRRGWIK